MKFPISAILVFTIVSFVSAIKSSKVDSNGINRRSLENNPSELRFISVGDWGSGFSHQQKDADAIGEWCSQNRCDFVISTGDNFYLLGVDSADDSQFQTTWRDVYSHPSIANLTWYVTAGNHDHGLLNDGREWYEVEHSKTEPRWYFPDLAYSFEMTIDSSIVKFVTLDTESIERDKNNAEGMIDFLETELKDPEPLWKIVFGHHPCYSAAHYNGFDNMRNLMLPIMKNYDTDIYLTGHDHNQQHISNEEAPDIDHIITGAGGAERMYGFNEKNYDKIKELGMELRSLQDDYGFTYFVINEDSISWKFINSDLELWYEHTRYK